MGRLPPVHSSCYPSNRSDLLPINPVHTGSAVAGRGQAGARDGAWSPQAPPLVLPHAAAIAGCHWPAGIGAARAEYGADSAADGTPDPHRRGQALERVEPQIAQGSGR